MNPTAAETFPADVTATLGLREGAGQPWYRSRWAIVTFVVAATVVVVWLMIARRSAADKLQYEAASVARRDLVVTVSATGTLEPKNAVDVGSEVSGTVDQVLVDFNDPVRKGQTLVRLNRERLEAAVTQSRGSLETAVAALQRAEANQVEGGKRLARVRVLTERDLAPVEELETNEAAVSRAEADLASARAQVTVAQAALESNQLSLQKAVIRSPINGFVLTRMVDPGQTLAASFQAPGAVAASRESDPDGVAGRRRRGRHRPGPGGPKGHLHG